MKSIISLQDVRKVFGEKDKKPLVALENISLEIYDGEFFVFVGPSGCGKSTLLRIMSGLEKNYRGEAHFRDDVVREDVSFVFQHFALLPWLTAYENVELSLIAKNIPFSTRRRRVMEELKKLQINKVADLYPKELSGGMRQRVGIARALVSNPRIIFMDEPFSELDSFIAEKLRLELLDIWQKQGLTIVMVTHIIEEALQLADRIAVLTSRPGKIMSVVQNELPRPREKRSSDFYKIYDEIYGLVVPVKIS